MYYIGIWSLRERGSWALPAVSMTKDDGRIGKLWTKQTSGVWHVGRVQPRSTPTPALTASEQPSRVQSRHTALSINSFPHKKGQCRLQGLSCIASIQLSKITRFSPTERLQSFYIIATVTQATKAIHCSRCKSEHTPIPIVTLSLPEQFIRLTAFRAADVAAATFLLRYSTCK